MRQGTLQEIYKKELYLEREQLCSLLAHCVECIELSDRKTSRGKGTGVEMGGMMFGARLRTHPGHRPNRFRARNLFFFQIPAKREKNKIKPKKGVLSVMKTFYRRNAPARAGDYLGRFHSHPSGRLKLSDADKRSFELHTLKMILAIRRPEEVGSRISGSKGFEFWYEDKSSHEIVIRFGSLLNVASGSREHNIEIAIRCWYHYRNDDGEPKYTPIKILIID